MKGQPTDAQALYDIAFSIAQYHSLEPRHSLETAHASYVAAAEEAARQLNPEDSPTYVLLARILRDAGWAHFQHSLLLPTASDERLYHEDLALNLLQNSLSLSGSDMVDPGSGFAQYPERDRSRAAEHGATATLLGRIATWLSLADKANTPHARGYFCGAEPYLAAGGNLYYAVSNAANAARFESVWGSASSAWSWLAQAHSMLNAARQDDPNFTAARKTFHRLAFHALIGWFAARRSIAKHP